MNNINVRNILIVLGIIVAVVLGMNVLATLLGAIIPIIITAVVAFTLGRLSGNQSLLSFARSARDVMASVGAVIEKTAPKAAAEKPATVQGKATPVQPKAAAAPASDAPPALKNTELLDTDFEVKTPEQIEAEVRLREQELSQKAAPYDAKAALEERKRRLLGNKDGG